MIHFLLLFNFLYFSYATDIKDTSLIKNHKSNGESSFVLSKTNAIPMNRTFIDKSDNVLRVPNAYHEERRKGISKKSPKRTIQKIIKKNKLKRKRLFVLPVSLSATAAASTLRWPAESDPPRHDAPATEASSRRRARKSPKALRNHMPFHKVQQRARRSRRDAGARRSNLQRRERDADSGGVMILKDLDEIEFVRNAKDYNLIRAHVQNYW